MFHYSDLIIRGISGRADLAVKSLSMRNKGDYVVLVPGVVGGIGSMKMIAKSLHEKGYQVIPFDCSMRKYSIQVIATKFLHGFVSHHCLDSKKKIHFVTHSLGGIVVRRLLQEYHSLRIGKVVMMAPPHHGAEMVRVFDNVFLRKLFLGVPGRQINISDKSYVHGLDKKVKYDLGIISGNKSINPLSFFLIKGKNDGFVSVDRTKLDGMKGHTVIHSSHHGMLVNGRAINKTISFLRRGEF
jgi:triacylglycerol lipase